MRIGKNSYRKEKNIEKRIKKKEKHKEGCCALREDEIRQQVKELEREATAFHDGIALLRATLSLASEGESDWKQQLAELFPQGAHTPEEIKLQALIIEGWKRERLQAYALRSLYHQLIETKRRFLYHWHRLLQRHLYFLEPERRRTLTALLDDCLQGLLSVGIEELERAHRQELEQILERVELPFHPSTISSSEISIL